VSGGGGGGGAWSRSEADSREAQATGVVPHTIAVKASADSWRCLCPYLTLLLCVCLSEQFGCGGGAGKVWSGLHPCAIAARESVLKSLERLVELEDLSRYATEAVSLLSRRSMTEEHGTHHGAACATTRGCACGAQRTPPPTPRVDQMCPVLCGR
jgi:hypothetical protein